MIQQDSRQEILHQAKLNLMLYKGKNFSFDACSI